MTSIQNPISVLLRLSSSERLKAALLSGWFFLTIAALWLLKPVRTASLLVHLEASELPYLRFGAVIGVGVVVLAYSRAVNHFSRLNVVRGSSSIFALVLLVFWAALRLGGEALGSQRWFVWAIFILVDIYSTLMVAIFWTYTNDVVSRVEADKLYGPIGIGGILGGIVGGVAVDVFVETVGPIDLLLVCAGLVLLGGGLGWISERMLKPAARQVAHVDKPAIADALEGAREVLRNPYLLAIVGIVVAYEFAAATTDFVINVVFQQAFHSQVEIAQMYGRLGWIVSGTALLSQLLLVPVLLPFKRVALLVPPIAMAAATVGLAVLPIVGMAIVLAASDRGLNYSLQQVTKETLYVPLSDLQRYKAKAFIDVFVDRAAKALSSVAVLVIIGLAGVSIAACLAVALAALVLWMFCANALGRAHATRLARVDEQRPEPLAVPEPLLERERAVSPAQRRSNGVKPAPSPR
jgi:ATP:ADP antiporter, AAA family